MLQLLIKNDERWKAADDRLDRMEDMLHTLKVNNSGTGLVMDGCDLLKEDIFPLENKEKLASFSNSLAHHPKYQAFVSILIVTCEGLKLNLMHLHS